MGKSGWLSYCILLCVLSVLGAGCAGPRVPAKVLSATMSRAVDSNHKPVDPTDVFEPGATAIHCAVEVRDAFRNRVKVTFVAVNALDKPNVVIDEREVTVNGTRYVDFWLEREGGAWPVGRYRCEIYLDGELERSVAFRVQAPAPTRVPGATQPDVTPTPAMQITAVTAHALDAAGDASEPTDVFAPEDQAFYLVVKVTNAPNPTPLRVVWTAVDVINPPNYKLEETSFAVSGNQTVPFKLKRGDKPWPKGKYKAELYVNNALVKTVEFAVAPK